MSDVAAWIREATKRRRDRWIEEGRKKGRQEGREEVRQEGREEGRQEGREEGYNLGYRDRDQGRPPRYPIKGDGKGEHGKGEQSD